MFHQLHHRSPSPRSPAMTLTSRLRRTASLAAITAVAGAAALAGTASAATIQKAPVLQPGATIPVDFPGYKEPANNKLKANYRILVVRAEVARGERPSTIISAPKGFELVTLRPPRGRRGRPARRQRLRRQALGPPDAGREPQQGRPGPDRPRHDLRARASRRSPSLSGRVAARAGGAIRRRPSMAARRRGRRPRPRPGAGDEDVEAVEASTTARRQSSRRRRDEAARGRRASQRDGS